MNIKKNTDISAIKRFVSGFYTKEDVRTIFNNELREQHIQDLNPEMDSIWGQMKELDQTDEPTKTEYKEEAWELLKRIQKQEEHFNIRSILKYAAILLVTISATLTVYHVSNYYINSNISYTEIRVKNGQNKDIVLPDGTKVTLNAGTYFRYPNMFRGGKRQVEIDGEAFFNVKHDERNPFIITAEGAKIRVLGTSFNVKAYKEDDELSVSVKTGKVQVNMPEAMMRIKPDELVIINKRSGEFTKRIEKSSRITAWMNGGLYFNKTPIQSVVKELRRIYDCEIVFESGKEYNEYIYGEHDNKSLESVLKSIQYATNIMYRYENGKIVLYKE